MLSAGVQQSLLSFVLTGEFAAFRDPSVTTNQTVYFIPSKSAIIGMLGAMIGVERGHGIEERYSKAYLELFGRTKIGIQLMSKPEKVSFFTNHRSLKETKTKPFKTELVVKPRYRIYVSCSESGIMDRLYSAVSNASFVYPPYLGHSYCHATILESALVNARALEGGDTHIFETSAVILDESETYNPQFQLEVISEKEGSSMIIERHLHHFIEYGQLQARVLKHWIPIGNSSFKIQIDGAKLSTLVSAGNDSNIVCLY